MEIGDGKRKLHHYLILELIKNRRLQLWISRPPLSILIVVIIDFQYPFLILS
jgi:hypothetical protein